MRCVGIQSKRSGLRRYDVVASENADVNTVDNIPHYTDCGTPNGFTGGNFSSLIVFVDQQ